MDIPLADYDKDTGIINEVIIDACIFGQSYYIITPDGAKYIPLKDMIELKDKSNGR